MVCANTFHLRPRQEKHLCALRGLCGLKKTNEFHHEEREGSEELTLPREFRYLFTCQEWDATTALYYYDARWYDSATGRFTTQDPLGFAAGDENLYRYCMNDPTNKTDPSGLLTDEYTGPCEIKLWFGDTIISRGGGMGNFIGDNSGKRPREICPSRYLGVVGCGNWEPGADTPVGGKPIPAIPPNQTIPGFPPNPDMLSTSELMNQIEKALDAAEAFAKQLCKNRQNFCDDGTPQRYKCGADNQRCDSVTITVQYDKKVIETLRNGGPESMALLQRLNKILRNPKPLNCKS
jgi:RHS repeat-associated protein